MDRAVGIGQCTGHQDATCHGGHSRCGVGLEARLELTVKVEIVPYSSCGFRKIEAVAPPLMPLALLSTPVPFEPRLPQRSNRLNDSQAPGRSRYRCLLLAHALLLAALAFGLRGRGRLGEFDGRARSDWSRSLRGAAVGGQRQRHPGGDSWGDGAERPPPRSNR